MEEKALLVITGPTATGKTARAVAIAQQLGGEIISADSRQVYRGMDIGTGKDLDEYGQAPYHLIDIAPAGYKYNLYEYLRDFDRAEALVRSHGAQPILCGGTGLYVESVLKGLKLPDVPANPELRESLRGKTIDELEAILREKKTLHNTTDIDTCQRAIRAIEIATYYEEHPDAAVGAEPHPRTDAVVIGVDISRELRRERITARLHARLDAGMVEEGRALLESGISPDDLMYYGLEYKYLTLYLTGKLQYKEMVDQLEIAIHQFAKRQMTWFRGMERRGFHIHWLSALLSVDDFAAEAIRIMEQPRCC
ncbi:MAG: tRNA (adenosine(37)-N6)-dimethylallyltransferase MiaA [Bacteroidales bacterium]|nr:tRNA (adenosine(37)-N6)-dimethylallyltransferase MiaA [Bacteroidales bacterium]